MSSTEDHTVLTPSKSSSLASLGDLNKTVKCNFNLTFCNMNSILLYVSESRS